jgi:hypothetical protein
MLVNRITGRPPGLLSFSVVESFSASLFALGPGAPFGHSGNVTFAALSVACTVVRAITANASLVKASSQICE